MFKWFDDFLEWYNIVQTIHALIKKHTGVGDTRQDFKVVRLLAVIDDFIDDVLHQSLREGFLEIGVVAENFGDDVRSACLLYWICFGN